MKVIVFSSFLAIFTTAQSHADGTDCNNLNGTWETSSGTTLTVTEVDVSTGKIDIEFKSSPNLFKDGPFKGTGLIGKIPEETEPGDTSSKALPITFSIKWPEGSVSGFTGYCRNVSGIPTIKALWHESQPVAKLPIYHIQTNSTFFRSNNYRNIPKNQL